ncbi:MAG: DUF4190 domain-containing protein [Armatimonadota bacterium]
MTAENAPAPPPPPPPVGVQPPPQASMSPMSGGGPPQQPSQTALWALLCGIGSIICCGLLGIPTIILANNAKNDPNTDQGQANIGKILGIIGLVLTGLGIAIWIVAMIVGISRGMSSM